MLTFAYKRAITLTSFSSIYINAHWAFQLCAYKSILGPCSGVFRVLICYLNHLFDLNSITSHMLTYNSILSFIRNDSFKIIINRIVQGVLEYSFLFKSSFWIQIQLLQLTNYNWHTIQYSVSLEMIH